MYISDLEVFLAVARTLNVSRAAKQLNLAQSTVSKKLQVLEREVDTSLIERGQGAKSIRLTPAGEEFVDIAQRMSALWSKSYGLKSACQNCSLSIGSLDSLNCALFPPLYQLLSRHQPRINLSVTTSHSPDLYNLVDCRQVDVAFTLLERTHPNIFVEKCYSEPMVVLRTSSPTRTESAATHPHELESHHEIYQVSSLSYQIWHDLWWNPLCPTRIRIDTTQLIFSFLCDEQQWAIVPLSVAKMAKSRGNFSIFPLIDAPPERVVYKITHKHPKPEALEGLKILDHYLKTCLPENDML